AGALTAMAAAGGLTALPSEAKGGESGTGAAKRDEKRPRGMAKGLTLLTFRRNGDYRLGVKTGEGILDVPEASRLLKKTAPAAIDELLQNEDGPSLNALVDAAMKSSATKSAFLKEEGIEYGPVVTRPQKILCVGLNYRKHAQEIGAQVPKQPVLFSKFNTA